MLLRMGYPKLEKREALFNSLDLVLPHRRRPRWTYRSHLPRSVWLCRVCAELLLRLLGDLVLAAQLIRVSPLARCK